MSVMLSMHSTIRCSWRATGPAGTSCRASVAYASGTGSRSIPRATPADPSRPPPSPRASGPRVVPSALPRAPPPPAASDPKAVAICSVPVRYRVPRHASACACASSVDAGTGGIEPARSIAALAAAARAPAATSSGLAPPASLGSGERGGVGSGGGAGGAAGAGVAGADCGCSSPREGGPSAPFAPPACTASAFGNARLTSSKWRTRAVVLLMRCNLQLASALHTHLALARGLRRREARHRIVDHGAAAGVAAGGDRARQRAQVVVAAERAGREQTDPMN